MRDSVLTDTNIRRCQSLPEPEESFSYSSFLSKQRQLRSTYKAHPSWRSRKLKEWARSNTPSLIIARGTCLTRHETKDFATEMVALLRATKIPVIWTLSAKADSNSAWRSPVDILKQLVLQILHLNQSLLNDESPALNATRFQNATKESECFAILASVLSGLEKLYIVVDAEIMNREMASQISWTDAFNTMLEDLKAVSCKTVVKIVLVSSGNSPYISSSQPATFSDVTIRIEKGRRTATKRKHHFRSRGSQQGSNVLRPLLQH
jgi:hypothetical protein